MCIIPQHALEHLRSFARTACRGPRPPRLPVRGPSGPESMDPAPACRAKGIRSRGFSGYCPQTARVGVRLKRAISPEGRSPPEISARRSRPYQNLAELVNRTKLVGPKDLHPLYSPQKKLQVHVTQWGEVANTNAASGTQGHIGLGYSYSSALQQLLRSAVRSIIFRKMSRLCSDSKTFKASLPGQRFY